MAIPVILRGDTARPIKLTLADGYDYGGCSLLAEFCGARREFANLAAGGSVEMAFAADETAGFPLGTSRILLSLRNAAGEVRTLPWAKAKVTDAPGEVYEAAVAVDPGALDVDDLTAADSLGAVKSRLNAVMAFLRGRAGALCLAALAGLPALAAVKPLYTTPNEMPGDARVMMNAAEYVDAKTADVPAIVTNVVEGVVDEGYVSSRARQISQRKNGIYTRVAIGDDNVPYVEVPPKKASKLVPDGSPFATSNAVTAALAPYAKKTEIPSVPTKVSAFENDKGYLTGESDPTVPAWAKAAKKPTYTASEVGAVPTSRKVNGKALSADVTLGAADVNAYTKDETAEAISSALALKADKSALFGYATTAALAAKADKSELAAVTNAVRETVRETGALFWDAELEVTWQGRFEGGNLYYAPVTNVNATGRD